MGLCSWSSIFSILSRVWVTVDGVWIGNRIYWPRDYTLWITITHRLVFSVTVFTALLGNGFQRRTFPFLWVLELSPSSATIFSFLTTTTLSWLSACRPSLYWLGISESESELLYDWRVTANQSSWRRVLWNSRPVILFSNWTLARIVLM
jgi:hypothetical protein